VLKLSRAATTATTGYPHLAPIAAGHLDEMEGARDDARRAVVKISCSTAATGCTARPAEDEQRTFLMIGPEDHYDLAHFEFRHARGARISAAHRGWPSTSA